MWVAVIIRESLVTFRGLALQISGCESLFLKLSSQDQLALLLVYQPPCCKQTPCMRSSLLSVEFPRLMVLGDFNLSSLGLSSEVAQEFMATMMAMGLSQIIMGLTLDSSHMPDMIFREMSV